MKKVLILMLGLVAGSASFAQSAADVTAPTVLLKTNRQAIQLYIQPVASMVTVNLVDAQGHILYSVKTDLINGFSRQFNVSALEAGSYHLSIQTAQQKISKPFLIEEQSIQRHISLQA